MSIKKEIKEGNNNFDPRNTKMIISKTFNSETNNGSLNYLLVSKNLVDQLFILLDDNDFDLILDVKDENGKTDTPTIRKL